MRLSSLLPFVTGAVLIPHAYAWQPVGHEVVATIAQMYLHPSVMPKLCNILHITEDCHLAPVATWADNARKQPDYAWSAALHFIGAVDDNPGATCAFPGPQGWAGQPQINVLNGIRNTTTVLQEFEGLRRLGVNADADAPRYVQDALKFLIHFFGDVQQPLHLTGHHRGGNDDKVAFNGQTTNLHFVWDELLISERIRTLPGNYTDRLPLPDVESNLRDTAYDPYIRLIVWEGLLGKWHDDLDAWLACPSSSPSARRPPAPASAWQTILSLFSSASKGGSEGEDGSLGADDDTLCPYAWAKPIHQLLCEFVVPKELNLASPHRHSSGEGCARGDANVDPYDTQATDSPYLEVNTPEYAGLIKQEWIIEKLLAQGAIRLASTLNWIFAELD